MPYPATAKQRLWLRCLGFAIPRDATADFAGDVLDRAKATGRYSAPPIAGQLAMALALGISIPPDDTRSQVAGQSYELLLGLGWVYSVWRDVNGESGSLYSTLSLSNAIALAAAHQINDAFTYLRDDFYPTSEEPDLFYFIGEGERKKSLYDMAVSAIERPK